MKIKWDNDEVSWEPLNEIRLNDALKVAQYGTKHELTGKHGWKWARKYAKKPTKFIRLARIFQSQIKKSTKMYKFGIEVPENV